MQLVWLRNDLRLEDNPALYYARQQGPVCCIFIDATKQWTMHDDAIAKINFRQQRINQLKNELSSKNIPLKIISVDFFTEVPDAFTRLIKSLKTKNIEISSLWFNHEYPLNEKLRDQSVIQTLTQQGILCRTFHGDVVHPPGTIKTQGGTTYHVFSAFARQWRKQVNENLLILLPPPRKQAHTEINDNDPGQIYPGNTTNYRDDLWPSDKKEVHRKLRKFIQHNVLQYKERRDIPSIAGTSTLSPYLMCGAISVRQCIAATREQTGQWLENTWVNELIWRDFYRHLIDAYPHLSKSENFKTIDKPIPWENDSRHWQAWCNGTTGYPIVDAAMKQLIQTGWMHNRLRMIVAAFLTKLLLIDWRKGERFFMQHLIDGDYASNNGGWQWAASTGADAVPYFRIFNPTRQSERFDPEGKFIKKFLPELSSLDKKSIHDPDIQQREACNYPAPIIDYKFSRQRALDVYAGAMGKP